LLRVNKALLHVGALVEDWLTSVVQRSSSTLRNVSSHSLEGVEGELLTSQLLWLVKGNVERLLAPSDGAVVHLVDGTLGLFRGAVANETKSFGGSLLVGHDLAGLDGSPRSELSLESLLIDFVFDVLNVS